MNKGNDDCVTLLKTIKIFFEFFNLFDIPLSRSLDVAD